jgi:hypothetical protein
MACSGIALAFSSRSSSCNRVIHHIICNFSSLDLLCLCNAFEMSMPRLYGITLHLLFEDIGEYSKKICHFVKLSLL